MVHPDKIIQFLVLLPNSALITWAVDITTNFKTVNKNWLKGRLHHVGLRAQGAGGGGQGGSCFNVAIPVNEMSKSAHPILSSSP